MHGTKAPLDKTTYRRELERLRREFAHLQNWVQTTGQQIVVLCEGRDAAGKGGTIKRIAGPMNPQVIRVAAFGKPSEREVRQWFYQRYVEQLPARGELVLFDRSWYSRALVERVMGYARSEDVEAFLATCSDFERMLLRSGIQIVKYWFSVSPEEQERRFERRRSHPTKHWKLSENDVRSRELWDEYSKAQEEMFARTELPEAPWFVINSDDKRRARLNCMSHLLSLFDYDGSQPRAMELPPRTRPPSSHERPEVERLREIITRY